MSEFTQMSEDFNIDFSIENFDNKNITHTVVKSNTTESVYVTYHYNEKEAKVRFSNHSSNALKFGDVLNGFTVTQNEILCELGLMNRVFIPEVRLSVPYIQIKKTKMGNYKECNLSIKEIYALGAGANITEFKGMLCKGSNHLIQGDEIEQHEVIKTNHFGQDVRVGNYKYVKC